MNKILITITFLLISCGKESGVEFITTVVETKIIAATETISIETTSTETIDSAIAKGYGGVICNKPLYASSDALYRPEAFSKSGGYEYHVFGWQLDEGFKNRCVNIYEGVSGADKQLVEDVLLAGSERLGQIVPINLTVVFGGVSNMDDVNANWNALKLSYSGLELGPPDSDYYVAAAGVDWESIHNGGQGEISQAVYRDLVRGRKTIYHEFFHIHQNSHKYYFEETKTFGWNETQIKSLRDSKTSIPLIGPVWIEEGGAEFAGQYLSGKKRWIDYKAQMIDYLDEARSVISDAKTRNDIVSLKDYENGEAIGDLESTANPTGVSREKAYQYSAGALAHIYAIESGLTTLDKIIIDYYKDLAELEREHQGEGYKYSFKKHWSIELDDFYKEFNAFMLKSREEQIAILKLS
tara:strand:- start:27 stop:1256 length:1230 start_codon:yes stop_codon:yes gene_type:complete